jgi:hypothetical protein
MIWVCVRPGINGSAAGVGPARPCVYAAAPGLANIALLGFVFLETRRRERRGGDAAPTRRGGDMAGPRRRRGMHEIGLELCHCGTALG